MLTSRNGVKTGYQARCLHFWRRSGVQVVVSTQRIADKAGAQKLITSTKVAHILSVQCLQ